MPRFARGRSVFSARGGLSFCSYRQASYFASPRFADLEGHAESVRTVFMEQARINVPTATAEQHAAAEARSASMLLDRPAQYKWARNRFFFGDVYQT